MMNTAFWRRDDVSRRADGRFSFRRCQYVRLSLREGSPLWAGLQTALTTNRGPRDTERDVYSCHERRGSSHDDDRSGRAIRMAPRRHRVALAKAAWRDPNIDPI